MGMLAPFLAFLGIALMAIVTVTGAFLGGSDDILDARLEGSQRDSDLTGTSLELVGASYVSGIVTLDFRNSGRVPVRDTPSWDVWVSYHEVDGTFHPELLARAASASPVADEWALAGIYLDAANAVVEAVQPGIFDPSEEARLLLNLDPDAVDPQANTARLALPNGATALVAFTWEALADTPGTVDFGGGITNDGTYLYAMRGANQNDFLRYDVAAGTWGALANVPFTPTAGGAVAYAKDGGAGYVFAFRGENRKEFARYDIAADSWSSMANTPLNVDDGGAIAWDGSNTIYGTRGRNFPDFWAYSISGNSWSTLTDAPGNVNDGGALVYLDGAVYAFPGGFSLDLWAYTVSTNTWASLANTPATVDDGGSLVTDGTDLYAFRGDDNAEFWKYSVRRDTWTAFPDTPSGTNWGSMTLLNGVIYGLRGNNGPDFWQYPLPTYTP